MSDRDEKTHGRVIRWKDAAIVYFATVVLVIVAAGWYATYLTGRAEDRTRAIVLESCEQRAGLEGNVADQLHAISRIIDLMTEARKAAQPNLNGEAARANAAVVAQFEAIRPTLTNVTPTDCAALISD